MSLRLVARNADGAFRRWRLLFWVRQYKAGKMNCRFFHAAKAANVVQNRQLFLSTQRCIHDAEAVAGTHDCMDARRSGDTGDCTKTGDRATQGSEPSSSSLYAKNEGCEHRW